MTKGEHRGEYGRAKFLHCFSDSSYTSITVGGAHGQPSSALTMTPGYTFTYPKANSSHREVVPGHQSRPPPAHFSPYGREFYTIWPRAKPRATCTSQEIINEQTEVPKAPRTYTERESWACASHNLSQMTTPSVLQANLYVQENSHTVNLLMTFIDPTAYL